MKRSQILGIIVAFALILFGIIYPVPEKWIQIDNSYFAQKTSWSGDDGPAYIGGDAYNYQIEASLKAGYMSGVMAMKSISIVGGIALFFLTLYSLVHCAMARERAQQWMDEWNKAAKEQNQLLKDISEAQGQILARLPQRIEACLEASEEQRD